MRRGRAGFTLVELMIGVAIGGITVVISAQVAKMLVAQAAKGRQTTDFNSRSRVLGRQLRADIRMAGYGSTGAVMGAPGVEPFNTLMQPGFVTNFGYRAFAAVTGINNASGSVGGVNVLANSDAIMLVVPNPSRGAVTLQTSSANQPVLQMVPPAPGDPPLTQVFGGCDFVYIVDHSTPSGAGRVQVGSYLGAAGNTVTTDQLQFSVQPGADVLCARISTYWVSDDDGDGMGNWLRRSDLQAGNVPVNIGNGVSPVYVDATTVDTTDMVAPGILDLQIAYAFSAELWRKDGVGPPAAAAIADRWAYATPGLGPAANQLTTGGATGWFEVRMVRFNLLAKKMRAVDNHGNVTSAYPRAEDQSGSVFTIQNNVTPEWVVTTESVTNLRYYDMGLPEGTRAEPM